MKTLIACWLIVVSASSVTVVAKPNNGPLAEARQAAVPDQVQPVVSLQRAVDETISTKQGRGLRDELRSLRVPQPKSWFGTVFGSANGPNLSSIYAQSVDVDEGRIVEYFVTRAKPGGQIVTTVAAGGERQDSESEQAFDTAIRNTLSQPGILYRIEYKGKVDSNSAPYAFPLGYLLESAGDYRFLSDGVVRALPRVQAIRIRQGGPVVAAALIAKVPPKYPPEAKAQGVSGTVRLRAIIARDGTVSNIKVVFGDPLLAPAAVDAVRQWRYRPTTLNGVPVEVDTTIDVSFELWTQYQPNSSQ